MTVNSSDPITLRVGHEWTATNYNNSIVNENDALGDIIFFNAAAMGLNDTFTVNVTLMNTTK